MQIRPRRQIPSGVGVGVGLGLPEGPGDRPPVTAGVLDPGAGAGVAVGCGRRGWDGGTAAWGGDPLTVAVGTSLGGAEGARLTALEGARRPTTGAASLAAT